MSVRFHPPVEFAGEVPVHEYADEDENFAYREGRAYMEAEDITTVEAWVDLARKRVVGIDVDAFDDTAFSLEQDELPAKITRRDELEEPKPAGSRDDASACPKHELGD